MSMMSLFYIFLGIHAFELYRFIFMSGNTHINQDVIHEEPPLFCLLATAFLRKEEKDY